MFFFERHVHQVFKILKTAGGKKDGPVGPLRSAKRGKSPSVDSGLHLASSDLNYQLIGSQPGAVVIPSKQGRHLEI